VLVPVKEHPKVGARPCFVNFLSSNRSVVKRRLEMSGNLWNFILENLKKFRWQRICENFGIRKFVEFYVSGNFNNFRYQEI
jgi:hypothetical protein